MDSILGIDRHLEIAPRSIQRVAGTFAKLSEFRISALRPPLDLDFIRCAYARRSWARNPINRGAWARTRSRNIIFSHCVRPSVRPSVRLWAHISHGELSGNEF